MQGTKERKEILPTTSEKTCHGNFIKYQEFLLASLT